MAKRKRFVVVDKDGNEVDGVLYDSRHKAMIGPWDQAIAECGYSVKRVNLVISEHNTDGVVAWKRKEGQ
jgi:hypothetical protein